MQTIYHALYYLIVNLSNILIHYNNGICTDIRIVESSHDPVIDMLYCIVFHCFENQHCGINLSHAVIFGVLPFPNSRLYAVNKGFV
jgi:hypothetical protein